MREAAFVVWVVFFFLISGARAQAGEGIRVTNEMIYAKLLEIEKRQAVLETQFREFRESVNKRFEDMNKRFEDMNKRFEDVNRRFDEMRDDVNKRFDQLYTFLWVITGIFSALVAVVIGFALWDRRTTIRRAREESLEEVERVFGVSRLEKLLRALRELAREDARVAEVLRNFGLL
ncbi:hypothetical protein [Thermosulfurimonas sp. F29]|uniref:hypothetical protein n=1 Tax=Thermosulfurimonas sp. F29 TaxID=2867247 RepID=UPI001C8391B9|nr:hypothetical protein [Thermosulfurimonas sp. F29]MBX6422746.1 hypothetical protein [Thermosulfurimonas sp. F29]